MTWRSFLPARWSGSKNNPVSDLIILNLWGEKQLISPKTNLAGQAREGYERNVTVYSCINLIARSCAGIPWVLYQRGATPTSKVRKVMTFRTAMKAFAGSPLAKSSAANAEIENHPLLRLIEKPNPLQSGAEYTEEVMSYLHMTGNSYETWVAGESRAALGRPLELWSLRPDRMYIIGGILGSGREISAFEYRVGTGKLDFDPKIILHQKFFSPLDDFFGLSPIQVAALIIDGDNSAALWNRKLLTNDARPPAALVIKGGAMDATDRERLKAELEARYSGPDNARRPLIAEGDVDWKLLAMSPAELDWLEGRKMNRREIAQAYTVPPELIGDVDAQSYASKEQARKGLYQENICPLMDRRRDNLNNSVVPPFGDGLFLDYDRDQIEALHEDSQRMYLTLRSADWLSVDEKRAATGYDEWKGNAETDDPATVPVAFLKPAALPGAPEDAGNPADGKTPTAADATASAAVKAQQLSRAQKKREAAMQRKIAALFRKQQKALAEHLRTNL
jgi:HK97 family phage portal protein